MSNGRDSEIAPTKQFLFVGGNSDSQLLTRLAISEWADY